MECTRTEVGRFDHLSDEMCLADPRSLDMRNDDRYGMTFVLQSLDEGVDVGR